MSQWYDIHLINNLIDNSREYKTLSKDEKLLSEIPGSKIREDLVDDEGPDESLMQQAYTDTNRVNCGNNDFSSAIESNSGLFYLPQSKTEEPKTVFEYTNSVNNSIKHRRVINSNMYLSESDVYYYGAAFFHLFPYSQGNRKFGQDDVFTLSAFDCIARNTCCTSLYIKTKRDTTTKDGKNTLKCGYNSPAAPTYLKQMKSIVKGYTQVRNQIFVECSKLYK